MSFVKQLFYLMKQELRSASRSKYIIISFFFLPLFMWGLQGGLQILVNYSTTSTSNLTVYVTNQDKENIIISEPFYVPFHFENYEAGTIIPANTNFSLSSYFVESLKWSAKNDNQSTIYNANIIENDSVDQIELLKNEGKVEYWININTNFSQVYQNQGTAFIELEYLQKSITGPAPIKLALNQILSSKPFTIVDVKKYGTFQSSEILIGGESTTGDESFSIGFAGFMGILLAVTAPASFVSTTFAGEREKKTLESLLALPISRKGILIGKLASGMVLVCSFAVVNIIGMELYIELTKNINYQGESFLAFDLTVTTIFAVSIAMLLSAFIAIGLGISIVSFAKDVRTSESMYQFILLIPSMIVGLATWIIGVPENTGGLALLLYLIPFTHGSAIFQKLLRPNYYNITSLTGFGLYADLLFHFSYLILSIGLVIYLASKVFEREGILN